MSKESVFEQLSKVNVNNKTDKKGKFTYLSWAFDWAELKKLYPEAQSTVYHDELTNKPYFGAGEAGVLVKVGVTVNGVEHINYLPCMDFKNKAIAEEDVSMMDVNKAIQRATVKAIGLHGLGLYIYAGEDLPEEERTDEPKKTSSRKKAEPKEAKAEKPKRERRTRGSKEEPKEESKSEENTDEPKKSGFRRK